MGFLKKEKRTAVSVQTQGGDPPVLPVTAGERALDRALREQVPIIDAAIYKLVRLIGGFEVYCPEKHTENALRGFLKTVPVNGCNMGIDNFLSVYFEQLLTYGNAIGEIVLANGEIRALYNASLEDLEIRLISPLETGVFVVRDGRAEPCRYPELILTSALNPMPGSAMGSSILKGLPFVSEVLLKIYRTVGINWERMGNVRFAVTCKNEGYMNAGDRAGQLAKEWSRAMHGPGVSDFVAVGDVQIKAIGADGQQMDRLAWLEKGWYEGALAFAREAGGEAGNKAGPYDGREGGNGNGNETRAGTPGNADIIAPRSFELHLLSLQLETREFLEAKLKDHATPGGMTEEAVSGFRQLWTGKDWMEGDVSMAYDISYRLAERVYKKGKALEKRR